MGIVRVLNLAGWKKGEIVLYQPDNSVSLEVRMEEDTVWLTQGQMAKLFDCSVDNIGLHLKNIYAEGEIDPNSTAEDIPVVRWEGRRQVTRRVRHYNLDAILSVGYRISSKNATLFRQWATRVLKNRLLQRDAIAYRMAYLEQKVQEHDVKIDFFVRTSLPPVEGVFYNGQIFDAYSFVSELIKTAKRRILLIDNYVDNSVLLTLSKRQDGVSVLIITRKITETLKQDIVRFEQQYSPVEVRESSIYHDRFLIIDETVYHLGASLKDLGKKLFAFSRLNIPYDKIVNL